MSVYCSWFGRKRKSSKGDGASTADGQDVAVYEEVVRLPAFTRKTLVLLGNANNDRRACLTGERNKLNNKTEKSDILFSFEQPHLFTLRLLHLFHVLQIAGKFPPPSATVTDSEFEIN